VLDDTLDPSERQDDEQQAAGRPADSVEAPTSFQLQLQLGTEAYQATEIHTGNGEAIPAPASVQHADVARGALPNTLQQLGLDSPALHGQAVGQGEAGEPEQAAPVTAEVMRPSTQEPDQAASVWTPLSPDDGWRPKKKRKSTGNSPSPKPEGKHHCSGWQRPPRPFYLHLPVQDIVMLVQAVNLGHLCTKFSCLALTM